jgi:hypothetical protein
VALVLYFSIIKMEPKEKIKYFVNVLNLHRIDLARNITHIFKEKLRKKKQERKNGRIIINYNE